MTTAGKKSSSKEVVREKRSSIRVTQKGPDTEVLSKFLTDINSSLKQSLKTFTDSSKKLKQTDAKSRDPYTASESQIAKGLQSDNSNQS